MLLSGTFEQAQENYVKNRGNPGQWFEHRADYRPPAQVPRVRPEAKEIVERNQPTISTLLTTYKSSGTNTEPAEDIHVRLRSEEAKTIADKFNFQEDKWFDYEGNQNYRPPSRGIKCYPQSAQEMAQLIHHSRSGDWFKETKKPPPHPPNNKSIGSQLRESRAEWFTHKAASINRETCRSAPSSPVPPRTRPEGRESAMKQRGTASSWMVHHNVHDDPPVNDGDAQPYRCTGADAASNWQQARGQDMAACFDHVHKQQPERIADRVKSGDAQEYLDRNRSGVLTLMIQGRATGTPTPRPNPRVRPEAEEIASKHSGQLGDWMDQSKNRDYQSPRPAARIRTTEAGDAAERNKGQMAVVVGKDTDYKPPAPRKAHQTRGIRSDDAKENLSKCNGSSLKELVENYRLPADPPGPQRVTGDCATEAAERNRGSVDKLFTSYGQQPPSPARGPRLRLEASEFAERHRGGDLLKTIQQKPPSDRT